MANSFLAIFDEIPCTIVQGLWPNFEENLKILILIGITSNCVYKT